MNRNLKWLCLIVSVCLLFSPGQAKVSDDQTHRNLIRNPGLEGPLDADKLPKGWGRYYQPAKAYRHKVVRLGRTGSRSLMIAGKSDGEWGTVSTNRVRIDRSKRYAARGWMRVISIDTSQNFDPAVGGPHGTAHLKLSYYDRKGKFVGQTVPASITPEDKGWHYVAITDSMDMFPDAHYMKLQAVLVGAGKAWFDDLDMVAIDRDGGENLIRNGGIENVIGSRPVGWYAVTSPNGKITIRAAHRTRHSGWHAMHLKSSGDWAVAGTGRVKLDHQKSYTLTGFARVKAGRVQIKIDYFHGDQRMGHVMSDDVMADADNPRWRKLKVTTGRTDLSDASHIGIGVVAMGDTEAFIDDLVLSVK